MTIDINDTNSQIEHFTNSYPKSWVLAKIYAICEPINGKAFKSSDWKLDGLPIIRIKNLNNSEALFNYYQGKVEEKFKVYNGDLLFAWSGTPGTSFGAHIWNGKEAVLNQHIFNISFNQKLINSKYFCFALNHNVSRYIEQAQGGVGLAHITKSKFVSSSIPLPPLSEQNRIIAKIEELLTRLDAGIKSLKQVQILLKKYRQSVLKSAVEGKLTSEWRKQHNDELEPGDKLLERILKERKEKWEVEQLANYKSKGIKPPKDWKEKYKEPSPPDTSDLPELPEGWVWTTIDQLSVVVRGASPRPAGDPRYFGGDIPWITVGALTADDSPFLFQVKEFVTENGCKKSRYIEPETLLLTNSGATLGVPKITKIGGCINDGSVAMFHVEYPLKLYLYYFFRTLTEKLRNINQGAAQPNLNTGIVKNIAVPLPPLKEQEVIIGEIERIMTLCFNTEKTVKYELKRSQSLRQSILKHAFEGKLVLQDPNDEPASVLLERIKAEKATLKK